MKKSHPLRFGAPLLLALGLCLFIGTGLAGLAQDAVQPPVAEKIKKELTIHGQTRIDNYYWLNERTNPKVIDYLKAENAYADAMMKSTEALRKSSTASSSAGSSRPTCPSPLRQWVLVLYAR